MLFIEAWMCYSGPSSEDPATHWQDRAAASSRLFQNEILNLIPNDNAEKGNRQQLLLDTMSFTAYAIKLPDEELLLVLQAMFDIGILAEATIFEWSSEFGN